MQYCSFLLKRQDLLGFLRTFKPGATNFLKIFVLFHRVNGGLGIINSEGTLNLRSALHWRYLMVIRVESGCERVDFF